MELKAGNYCPLLRKECIGLQCNWFIQVRGKNPNTGKDVDEWGCSIAWLPHLLIENANQTRQAGAATESFRNEMVKASDNAIKAMVAMVENNEQKPMRIIDASDDN